MGDRVIKLLKALIVASVFQASGTAAAIAASFDPEAGEALTVEVQLDFRFANDVSHSGFIVGDGLVLTVITAIQDRSDGLVVIGPDGTEYAATPLTQYRDAEVGLLAVEGLVAPAWIRAAGAPQNDVEIAAVGRVNGQLQVAEGALIATPASAARGRLHNTSVYQQRLLGGPVFDRCGSLIGISVPRQGADRRDMQNNSSLPSDFRLVRGLESLEGLLEVARGPVTEAEEICLPAAVEAARLEAAEAEEAAAAAREEAERLRRENEAARERERIAQEEAEALREQREEEARAAREEVQEITEEAQAANEAAQAATAARDEIEQRAEEESTRWRFILAAAVGIAIILLGVVGAIFAVRLSRQRSVAASAAAEAERLRSAQVEPFADCLLVSTTGAAPVALPGRLLPEKAGGVILGRNPTAADAVIASDDVSRRHARLFERGGELFVVDLGSSNGSFLNGRTLTAEVETKILAGDELRFAEHCYTLRIGA
jgi:hypothetical protein